MTNVIQMNNKLYGEASHSAEYHRRQKEITNFYAGILEAEAEKIRNKPVFLNDEKEIIGELFKANHEKLKEALKPGCGD